LATLLASSPQSKAERLFTPHGGVETKASSLDFDTNIKLCPSFRFYSMTPFMVGRRKRATKLFSGVGWKPKKM